MFRTYVLPCALGRVHLLSFEHLFYLCVSWLARSRSQSVYWTNKMMYCQIWCCDTSGSHVKHNVLNIYPNVSIIMLLCLTLFFTFVFFTYLYFTLIFTVMHLMKHLLPFWAWIVFLFDICMFKQSFYYLNCLYE